MCADPTLAEPAIALHLWDDVESSAQEQVDLPPLRSGAVVLTAASPKSESFSWHGWNPPQGQSPSSNGEAAPRPGQIPEHGFPRPKQTVPDRHSRKYLTNTLGSTRELSDGLRDGGKDGKGTGGAFFNSGGIPSYRIIRSNYGWSLGRYYLRLIQHSIRNVGLLLAWSVSKRFALSSHECC